MMEQNKRKMLFISPVFFDYYKDLIKAIEKNTDYQVKWYGDRPSESFFVKSITRLNKKIIYRKNKKYFNTIKADCLENKYDAVFVIFGQFLCKKYIEELRTVLPEAKFIYYTWDSSCIYPVIDEIADSFDAKYSFDPEDEKKGFKYVPLFYCNEMIKNETEYDAVSIFTIKPGKLNQYKKIKKLLPANISIYEHLYIQSKLVYLYYKLRYKKEFSGYKMKDFKFNKLSRNENNILISKSKCVIDCQMYGQSGLTMRTFETLHLNKKLITTNETIKKCDFYDCNNIFVASNEKVSIDFFNSSYENKYDITNYSIDMFVKKILGGEKI